MSEGGTDLSALLERRSFLLAVHGAVLGGGVIASCGSSISVTTTTQPGSIPTGSGTGNLSYPVEATGKGNLVIVHNGKTWSVNGTYASKSVIGNFQPTGSGASYNGSIGSNSLSGIWSLPGNLVTQETPSQPVSVKFDVR